jgi:hypothetical protein
VSSIITSISRALAANPIDLPVLTRERLRSARDDWRAARVMVGSSDSAPDLLTGLTKDADAGQTKFAKGEGHRIAGITLAPATEIAGFASMVDEFDLSGASACDFATKECTSLCLRGTGRQAFDYAALARAARTLFLLRSPESFAAIMTDELNRGARKFGKLAFRPDVLSDLAWDRIMPWMGDLDAVEVVYGYTKDKRKARRWAALDGWHATFSASERTNISDIRGIVQSGTNVAVPVAATKNDNLPDIWGGMRVVDGDANDRRYLDPQGVVVLLRAKVGLGNREAMNTTPVSVRSFIKPLAA